MAANAPRLLNKLGVTEIGLRNTDLARGYLKLAIKRDKKDAEAWNNLGATEYMDGRMGAGVRRVSQGVEAQAGLGGLPRESGDGAGRGEGL